MSTIFKLNCPGLKVPIRVAPAPTAESKRCLSNGSIIEVNVTPQAGYYVLTDGTVCSSLFQCSY